MPRIDLYPTGTNTRPVMLQYGRPVVRVDDEMVAASLREVAIAHPALCGTPMLLTSSPWWFALGGHC